MKVTRDEALELAALLLQEGPRLFPEYERLVNATGSWEWSFNHFLQLEDPFVIAYVTAAKLSGEI